MTSSVEAETPLPPRGEPHDPFNVGRFAFTGPPPSSPDGWIKPTTAAHAETLCDGDHVSFHGLRFQWWEGLHLRPSQFAAQRQTGDSRADAVVRALGSRTVTGGLILDRALAQRASSSAAHVFLSHAEDLSWVDWDQVNRGARALGVWWIPIGSALLHLSLLGGFSAPKIDKVLNSTAVWCQSKPAPGSNRDSETLRRVMETVHMLLTLCDHDGLRPGGRAWKAVLAVRLLHANVRVRLMDSPTWNMAEWGVPINQEDLKVTQLSFAWIPILGVERYGLQIPRPDMEALVYMWRVAGHLMGVIDNSHMVLPPPPPPPPSSSSAVNNRPTAVNVQIYLESLVLHLVQPDQVTSGMVLHLLRAVSGRLPLNLSMKQHVDIATRMAGRAFAEVLGMSTVVLERVKRESPPPTTLFDRLPALLPTVRTHSNRLLLWRTLGWLGRLPLVGRPFVRIVLFLAQRVTLLIVGGTPRFSMKHTPHPEELHNVEAKMRAFARPCPVSGGVDGGGPSVSRSSSLFSRLSFWIMCVVLGWFGMKKLS